MGAPPTSTQVRPVEGGGERRYDASLAPLRRAHLRNQALHLLLPAQARKRPLLRCGGGQACHGNQNSWPRPAEECTFRPSIGSAAGKRAKSAEALRHVGASGPRRPERLGLASALLASRGSASAAGLSTEPHGLLQSHMVSCPVCLHLVGAARPYLDTVGPAMPVPIDKGVGSLVVLASLCACLCACVRANNAACVSSCALADACARVDARSRAAFLHAYSRTCTYAFGACEQSLACVFTFCIRPCLCLEAFSWRMLAEVPAGQRLFAMSTGQQEDLPDVASGRR